MSSFAAAGGTAVGGGEAAQGWFANNRRRILVGAAVLLGVAALAIGFAVSSVDNVVDNSISSNLGDERTGAILTSTPPGPRESLPGACDLDILFVLDASGSVGQGFEFVKNFVVGTVQELYLDQSIGNLAVGVVTFNTGVTRILSLENGSLEEQLDLLQFGEIINAMTFEGGVTCTAGGLQNMKYHDLDTESKDTGRQTMVVLLTDGLPNKYPEGPDGCIENNSCTKCAGGPGGPGLDATSADAAVAIANEISALEMGGHPVKIVAVGVGNVDLEFLDAVSYDHVRVDVAGNIESVIPYFTRMLTCEPEEEVTKYPTSFPTRSPQVFDPVATPSPSMSPTQSSGCDEAVDVVFIVDASSSIKSDNFDLVKQYVIDLAGSIGEFSQFSLVAFATGVTPYVLFGDSASTDISVFTEVVTNLPYPGGVTCSAGGMEYAYHNLLPLRRAAPIPTVAVFIGDGLPNKFPQSDLDTCASIIGCSKCRGGPGVPGPNLESRQAAVDASILLRGVSSLEQPVRVVGVGVGNNIDDDFLASISDTYQRVDSFDDLSAIVESVAALARCPITITEAPTASPEMSYNETAAPTQSPTQSPQASFVSSLPPTSSPTSSPTAWPSSSPTAWPSSSPTAWPSSSPTAWPSSSPTAWPSASPSVWPTASPVKVEDPTATPTSAPSSLPTAAPSLTPSVTPTSEPTTSPAAGPTDSPTRYPTVSPTTTPTATPTYGPTTTPTTSPSESPTKYPTLSPIAGPTSSPTKYPTLSPSSSPTYSPSTSPTYSPSASPTYSPSASPTYSPSASPTYSPSASPTYSPSASPTYSPSASPTASPSQTPSKSPTKAPSQAPSQAPSSAPTSSPTYSPSVSPSKSPSASPTSSPTMSPSQSPTKSPSLSPTLSPSVSPTPSPTYCIDIVDLVFVLDHSGSIEDFNKVKEFIGSLVDLFDVSPTGIRLALTTFDTFVIPKVNLLSTESTNKDLFKGVVNGIPEPEGGTCTAGALEFTRHAVLGIRDGEVSDTISLLRQHVPVAVLLITDGQPNLYREDTACENNCVCNVGTGTAISSDAVDAAVLQANSIRSASSVDYPIKLMSLGIGSVDEGFLGNISDQYMKIDGLEDLSSVVDAIRDMISCFPGTPNPTSTQVTTAPTPSLD